MKLPKILAPIKSFEEGAKVIEAGADEVYCGVRVPGMGRFEVKRMFNPVFEMPGYEELGKVTRYAHSHNVKVIVTVNQPFIVEALKEKIEKHFRSCIEEGVDAFLIGDVGVLSILKSIRTDVPFFASTYMITMNSETVEFLRKLGFSRVILDRQLTMGEIANIVERSKVEVEIFIHGGGCSNIDGSCYLFHYMFPGMVRYVTSFGSGMVRHVSPCTIPFNVYNLDDKEELIGNLPIMDAFEFCSLCKLPELVKLGVTGFKVEGRGGSLWYKESTIRVYRELLDLLEQENIEAFLERIEALRSGFFPTPPSIANLDDVLCSQQRCYYSPLFHSPYKMSLSWQSWTRTQFNTLVFFE